MPSGSAGTGSGMHIWEPPEGRTAARGCCRLCWWAPCRSGWMSPLCSSAGPRVVFAMVWMDALTQLEQSPLCIACLSSNFSVMQLHKYLSSAYVASNCRYSLCPQPDIKHMPASAAAAWWSLLSSAHALKQSYTNMCRFQRHLKFPGGMLSML